VHRTALPITLDAPCLLKPLEISQVTLLARFASLGKQPIGAAIDILLAPQEHLELHGPSPLILDDAIVQVAFTLSA
jgi:hypothetical protein